MRLLIITRKVDHEDERMGFMIAWLKGFARLCDHIDVLCLQYNRKTELPVNCKVYSLDDQNRVRNRLQKFFLFHKIAARLVPNVDGIFAHQNPEYGLLIAPWAIIYRKRMVAWYVHRSVTWKLRLLTLLSSSMVTASRESFRLPSKKVKILQHGIDTDFFSPAQTRIDGSAPALLSVSRLSPSKHIERMIEMMEVLIKVFPDALLNIVGAPAVAADAAYSDELGKLVQRLHLEKNVKFVGRLQHTETLKLYQSSDIFLNFSTTGSIDKSVLEAMSCAVPVLTSNEAFRHILDLIDPDLFIDEDDPTVLAERVKKIINEKDINSLSKRLRDYVVKHHNLSALLVKIVDLFRSPQS